MLTVTSLRNIWLRTCIGNIYLVTSREHLVTYREHLVTYSIYTVGNIWLHLRILFSFYEWYWHLQAFGEIVLKFIYIYILWSAYWLFKLEKWKKGLPCFYIVQYYCVSESAILTGICYVVLSCDWSYMLLKITEFQSSNFLSTAKPWLLPNRS